MRLLGVTQGYIVAQSWVDDIGEQPWKFALADKVFKLLDTKVEVMVLLVPVNEG